MVTRPDMSRGCNAARPIGCARAVRRGAVLVDAIVGTILLAGALAVMIGLSGRALSAQIEGEQLATAASLIDEQLNLVLAYGPDDYAKEYPTDGVCDPPFSGYRYHLDILAGAGGEPYTVRASVFWKSGARDRSASVETFIAARLGDDPDPDRRPEQTVERDE